MNIEIENIVFVSPD